MNLSFFYFLIYIGGIFKEFPVLAIAAGSIAGMGINYTSSLLIWPSLILIATP